MIYGKFVHGRITLDVRMCLLCTILTGIILSFAHTLGEFGVVLMIGGNIPNQTKVLSIEIYDKVETMDFASAHLYSITLVVFSFLILLFVYLINRKNRSIS